MNANGNFVSSTITQELLHFLCKLHLFVSIILLWKSKLGNIQAPLPIPSAVLYKCN